MRVLYIGLLYLCCFLTSLSQPFVADIEQSEKTQILVLATAHLTELFDDSFDPAWLNSLLDRLEQFNPAGIAVEEIPPHILQYMEFDESRYGFFTQMWPQTRIEMGREMQSILGISRSEAEQHADSLINYYDNKNMSHDQRIALIRYLIAAYDRVNAGLHWSYLPESYRETAEHNELPDTVINYLRRFAQSPNEITSIGLALAQRLNHSIITPVDDHMDSDIIVDIFEDLTKTIREHEAYHSFVHLYEQYKMKEAEMISDAVHDEDLFPLFEKWNSPEYLDLNMEQFKLYFRTDLQNRWDRRRMAQREVRDLNIASNVRRLSAYHPGERILVIIGASHKPFLDTYLSNMVDIEIVHLHELHN